MEIRQFQSVPISPLVGDIFALKWSEDNHVSVITEKGVHVLKILPTPQQLNPVLNFDRTFIPPPEYIPCKQFNDYLEKVVYDWPRQDVQKIMLEETLSPAFPQTAPVQNHIIRVCWSPKKLFQPASCLLTILSATGAVQLLTKHENIWKCLYDFTKSRAEMVKRDFKSANTKDLEFFQKNLRRLQGTSLAWSSFFGTYAYLAIAFRSSEIIVWKVPSVRNKNEIESLEVKFEHCWEDSFRVTALLWISSEQNLHLVVAGFGNGQIKAVKLNETGEKLDIEDTVGYVGDEDPHGVDFMEYSTSNEGELKIFAVKGIFLTILTLNLTGKLLRVDFFQSPGFSITGISTTHNNDLLVTTQDEHLHYLRSSPEGLVCQTLTDQAEKKTYQYLGLVGSPNRLYYLTISSPNTLFDHLKNRDPSNLTFFYLHNEVNNICHKLFENQEHSICKLWDYFELIKTSVYKFGAEMNCPAILDPRSISLYKLKCLYWLSRINEAYFQKMESGIYVELEKSVEIKKLIFVHSACDYLQKESTANHQLVKYLKNWLAEEEIMASPLLSKVKATLSQVTQAQFLKPETCELCNSELEGFLATDCPTGHMLMRCDKTLMQISGVKFRSCQVCKMVYHASLGEIKCICCDSIVLYDERVDVD